MDSQERILDNICKKTKKYSTLMNKKVKLLSSLSSINNKILKEKNKDIVSVLLEKKQIKINQINILEEQIKEINDEIIEEKNKLNNN